jgi:hypothetical protein
MEASTDQAESLAEVIEKVSPYVGKAKAMHVWLAENCTEDGIITPDRRALAKVSGAHLQYVTVWLWRAVDKGFLEVVVDRRGEKKEGSAWRGTKLPSTFRVVDPRAVWAA